MPKKKPPCGVVVIEESQRLRMFLRQEMRAFTTEIEKFNTGVRAIIKAVASAHKAAIIPFPKTDVSDE
jgi:hypothetical protein